jgi:predicted Rossmann-fold nucleotide-binding protein
MTAMPVRVPAAESLPGKFGINVALRPLKRRYPSSRNKILDVTATVEQIANGGPSVPILKPSPERWLEVALVVDESSSMGVWRETLKELAVLLARHGSFRDVRCWYVNCDNSGMKLYSEAGLPGSPRRLRDSKELIDASGRRLILIASDCVSPGWRSGAMVSAILNWGRRGPLALIQVLPERLWPATALGGSTSQFHAYSAGAPNSSLETRQPAFYFVADSSTEPGAGASVPLPVINLEGWSVAPWARLVANVGEATAEGITISQLGTAAVEGLRVEHASALPRDLLQVARDNVARFRAAASPAARQLAGYLSRAPLCLPVMRLVQKAMMPVVRQVDLAEVLLGGLFQEVPNNAVTGRPEDVFYEFLPGVPEILEESVSEADRWRVLREVSRLVESQAGSTIDFEALVSGDWSTLGPLAIYPLGQKFAEIAAAAIPRLSPHVGSPREIVKPPVESLLDRLCSVLVVGTGTFVLPQPIQLAALQVGAAVADAGANLIVGGWPGVDHLAARGFTEAQNRPGAKPVGELMQIVAENHREDYPGGRIERVSPNQATLESVKRADLVILIGGAGGTWLAFEQALAMNKFVLPFLNTGTDARHAAILLELFGNNVPRSLVEATFGSDQEARESGGQLRTLLTEFKPYSADGVPNNRELLWMTQTILSVAATYMRKNRGFDRDSDRILAEFQAHSLSQSKFEELVSALGEDFDPVWRNVAYIAVQARPAPVFVDPHMASLARELELGFKSRETRPLWRWLVTTNTLLNACPGAFRGEAFGTLEAALKNLQQRKDVDPGGECKDLLGKILRKWNKIVDATKTAAITRPKEVIQKKPAAEEAVVAAKKAGEPVTKATSKSARMKKAATPAKDPVVAPKKTVSVKAVSKKTVKPKQRGGPTKTVTPAKSNSRHVLPAEAAIPEKKAWTPAEASSRKPATPKAVIPTKRASSRKAVSKKAPPKKSRRK